MSLSSLSTHALTPLYERGISQHTIDTFAIRAARFRHFDPQSKKYVDVIGAYFPIYNASGVRVGWRGKRMGPIGPKKGWWDWHTDDAALWAYGVGTVRPDEPMLLTEGEADFFLMHTLGLPAATLLRGAKTAPSRQAIRQLTDAHPSFIAVAYDNDEDGRIGSVAVVRALRDAGLCADALALPATLPTKGDVTDLYHAVGRDRIAFAAAIKACERLPIPAPLPPRMQRITARVEGALSADRPWEAFNATHDIVDIAESVGDVKRAGKTYVMRCPFHDDHAPSLSIYPADGHFYCFSCGSWGSAYDLYTKARAA